MGFSGTEKRRSLIVDTRKKKYGGAIDSGTPIRLVFPHNLKTPLDREAGANPARSRRCMRGRVLLNAIGRKVEKA